MASLKADSPASYGDVQQIMDRALTTPGLIVRMSTAGRATNFKQRCNKYRNLLREIASEQIIGIPGHRAETAYDCLVIRQQDIETGKSSRTGRQLVFDHEAFEGQVIDPETGEEIEMNLISILEEKADE